MAEMPDQLKLARMAAVEEWRSKSFTLGGPLGNVLSRSYDLINTVMRNGVTDEMTVGYALDSLANERALAMNRDTDRDDPIRHLVYGLTESMGAMLETIREGLTEPAQQAPGQMDDPQEGGVSEHNDSGLPQFKEEEEAHEDGNEEAALLIAKEEQMEQHAQDHSGRQEDVVQPAAAYNAHDSQNDQVVQPTAPTGHSNDKDEEEEEKVEDEDEDEDEMDEDEEDDDEDEEEESVKDEEPCTSEQAAARDNQSRKRRRAFIDDEDEDDKDDKDDAYSGESDTETSLTRDSRLRPRKGNDDKRRSSRLCATGPKIYVDPDDNGQVTLSRRMMPVKAEEEEAETEEVDDHSCGQCDRKFDSARALSTHSRVHSVLEYAASNSEDDDDDFIDDRDAEGEEEEVEEPVPWRLRVRERVTKSNKFII